MARRRTCLAAAILIAASVSARADIRVTAMERTGFEFIYRPGTVTCDTVTVDGTAYQRFSADSHAPAGSPGSPALPIRTIFFAAPTGVQPAVQVTDLATATHTGITVAPVPSLSVDSQGFGTETFRPDPAAYARSGFVPETHAALDGDPSDSPVAVWKLTLCPVRFDAFHNTVTIADSMRVRVSFPGGSLPEAVAGNLPRHIINLAILAAVPRPKIAGTAGPFASGDWFRIAVSESGMYRITGGELEDAGFMSGTAPSSSIRMYYKNGLLLLPAFADDPDDALREIAITVEDGADGVFNRSDSIIFYGEALSRYHIAGGQPVYQNHPYSDTNVYWLTLSQDGTPRRLGATGETPVADAPVRTSFTERLHYEQENHLEVVYEQSHGGSAWYWDLISNATKSYTIPAPDRVIGTGGTIRIGIINYLYTERRSHRLDVYVNGSQVAAGTLIHPNEHSELALQYPGPLLVDNTVSLYRQGSSTDSAHMDWIEIEYNRELSLSGSALEFFEPAADVPVQYQVRNTAAGVRVYDTTDPADIRVYPATYDAVAKTVTFRRGVESGMARITLWNTGSYLSAVIERKENTNLRDPAATANYIVITHSRFLDQARDLANWRARDPELEPQVVDIQTIYDEFNGGVLDPISIRNYLRFAWENGNPDREYFCCIIGDTTYKYKNLTSAQANRSLVPTYSHYDDLGVLNTDDFFGWFDTFKVPYYAIGRLTVEDVESARAVVNKIIDYERNPERGYWHNRVLLAADDEYGANRIPGESAHTNATEDLDIGPFLYPFLERWKLLMIEYPMKNDRKPDATEDFIAGINDGYLLVNYVGHGNDDLLAHERLMIGARDVPLLLNGPRLNVFSAFSCTVGNYNQTDGNSLAEMLHVRPTGGSVAVVAASSLTYGDLNAQLNNQFYKGLCNDAENPYHRIGTALKLAKTVVVYENSNRYILFGDPATRLMLPSLRFEPAAVDTMSRLETVAIAGSIAEGGNPAVFEGTLTLKAQGPRQHREYKNGTIIRYTKPGKTFFIGKRSVAGGTFDASFVVPKDLDAGGDTIVHLYGSSTATEAAGALTGFAIGGLAPDADEDTAGPEIELTFDGVPFRDGATVTRQPHLRALTTDAHGVNVVGERGHNITLMVDDADLHILTEYYAATEDFRTGTVDFTLPVLSPGEHTLDLTVYDTYNNAAKKQVTVSVMGSETGDVAIRDLLNYPNPMRRNGTTFTFILSDDTRRADIKVYTQAGRLVDRIEFPAAYGFNAVEWQPPVSLANGVYFYKLSVTGVTGRTTSKIEKLVVLE